MGAQPTRPRMLVRGIRLRKYALLQDDRSSAAPVFWQMLIRPGCESSKSGDASRNTHRVSVIPGQPGRRDGQICARKRWYAVENASGRFSWVIARETAGCACL